MTLSHNEMITESLTHNDITSLQHDNIMTPLQHNTIMTLHNKTIINDITP